MGGFAFGGTRAMAFASRSRNGEPPAGQTSSARPATWLSRYLKAFVAAGVGAGAGVP